MNKVIIYKQGKDNWAWKFEDDLSIPVYCKGCKSKEEVIKDFKSYAEFCKIEKYEMEIK